MAQMILCIEDELPVSTAIRSALTLAGYEVETVTTAAEAIAAIKVRKPDLILLDLILPDITGFSFFELLRHGPMEHVPVIIVSGCTSPDAQYLGRRFGAVDYITKPFSAEDLVDRVRQALSQANARLERQKNRENAGSEQNAAPRDS